MRGARGFRVTRGRVGGNGGVHDDEPDRLFARFRDHGDVAALGALFDAVAPQLFRVALAVAHDAAEAEDLLQETFLAALGAAATHDPARPVVPWLVGILRHRAARARRRRRATTDASDSLQGGAASPADTAWEAERAARVHAALEALDEPQRTTALLRWRHGLEPSEIAALRREPATAVRARLHRALLHLRRELRHLAGVLPIVGSAAPRGLQSVRRAVLDQAGARAARGVSAAALGGAAAMSITKTCLVAGAALAACALLWFAAPGRDAVPNPAQDVAAGESAAREASREHVAQQAAPAPAPAPTVGPSVPPAPASLGPCVVGTVHDAGGAAIAGAAVRARRSRTPNEPPRIDAETSATTDAAGAFRVPVGDARQTFTIVADDTTHGADCALDVRVGEPVALVLRGTTAVAGRVTDTSGSGVVGAEIRAEVTAGTGWNATGLRVTRRGTSGDDGRFRIDGLPVGGAAAWVDQGVALVATAPRRPAASSRVPLSTAAGGTVTDDIVFTSGVRIAGVVRAAEDARPLADVLVACGPVLGPNASSDGPWLAVATTRTDARGAYAFDGVGRDVLCVRCFTPGRAAGGARVRLPEDGATLTVDLTLHSSGSVVGRIVDHEGRAVAGGHAALRNDDAWYPAPLDGAPPGRVVADEHGRFRIDGVPAGDAAPHAFVYAAPADWRFSPGAMALARLQSAAVEVAVARVGVTQVPDLVLPAPPPPDRRARVRVRDEAGAPVEGADVRAGPSQVARTDADGRAELVVAFAGAPALRAPRIDVHALVFARTARVLPMQGADDDVEIMLRPGHTLEGMVVDHAGVPVPFAPVTATTSTDGAQVWCHCTTDARGRFVARDLAAGPAEVSAYLSQGTSRPNLVATAREVEPGASDVVLAFPAPEVLFGELEFAVRDAGTGAAIVSASVSLRSAAAEARQEAAAHPGRIRCAFVEVGTWFCTIDAPGYVAERLDPLVVGVGAPTRREVRLARGATLEGTVRGVQLPLPAGARIEFAPVDASLAADLLGGRRDRSVELLEDGSFRAAGLARGTYRVAVRTRRPDPHATTRGLFVARTPLSVTGDASLEVDVVAAGSLQAVCAGALPPLGTEQGDDGALLAELPRLERTVLEVAAADGTVLARFAGAWDGYAGPLESCTLAAGAYVVRLRRADGTTQEWQATVRPDELTRVGE